MMKLFDLRADLSICRSFLRLEDTPNVWEGLFDGTSRLGSYPIPQGEREEEQADGPPPDFTTFNLAYPTFSERAIEILGDLLIPYGELAAIEMDEPMRYFGLNATTIVDALDEEKSKIKRFTDGGVMRVEQHVLRESVTSLPPIFKMPQTRRNTTYVNEQFVEVVQRHGLSGFRFDLLFER